MRRKGERGWGRKQEGETKRGFLRELGAKRACIYAQGEPFAFVHEIAS